MDAGQFRDRVSFYRLNETADDYGNTTSGFAATPYLTRWGRLRAERGRERLQAGRLESALVATLWVRRDSGTVTITAADKAVINGEDWQIRSIAPVATPPNAYLELTIERGVAV